MLINTNKIVKNLTGIICWLKEYKNDYYIYTINLEFVKIIFLNLH